MKIGHKILTLVVCQLMTFRVHAQFQDGTQILQSKSGTGFFGWAASELTDINGDSVTDYMVSSTGTSTTRVYSGSDGQLIHSFSLPNSSLGYALADAGDVDGDGVNDIITGGTTFNGSAGVAVVYSGSTGNEIWRISGENAGDRFGAAVSAAGDVNGDGRSDFLVGAESSAAQGILSGKAYVYSGSSGQIIRTYNAESSQDRFGGGVGLLGDVNADGVKDHIIGAYSAGANQGGKAYVYSGADGSFLFELNPDTGANVFGQFFVANAGDVNADGVEDIYVGDYNHANGAGRVYIYSGTNQEIIHRINGSAGEGAGPGRQAGDVNNDGFADVIVGYYTAETNQAGRVEVISGKDGSILQTMSHTIAGSQLGFDAVGIGDVNGDQMDDFLVTAANGNLVYVVAGNVERAPSLFINAGMNGAWLNPETSGQGLFVSVFPIQGNVFVGMFTFDVNGTPDNTAVLGDGNHRWLTGFGSINGNQTELQVFLTTGGLFDDPTPVNTTGYGSMTLVFQDCAHAQLTYSIPSLDLNGTIPLTRPTAENIPLCETLSELQQ